MTISDLVNEAQLLGFSGILEQSLKNTELGDIIVNKWDSEIDNIDLYIQHYYSDRQIFETIEQFTSPVIRALILSKKYEYDKLYGTLLLEYNPIENYSMQETGKDVTTSNVDNTSNIGKRDDTSVLTSDEYTDINIMLNGSRTDNTTNNIGKKTQITQVAPFDNTYQDKDKVTNDSATDNVNVVIGEQENRNTLNAGNRKQTNNMSLGAQTNTGNTTSNINYNHEFERKGNIGTLTTQKMIIEERQVALFSFVERVARDVVNAIAEGVWCVL